GIALEKQGELDEALISLRQAIELYPKDVSGYRSLARALLELQRTGPDSDRLRRAADGEPSAATAYLILGGVMLEKKKPDEAVVCFKRAIELGPNPVESNYLGYTLLDLKKPNEAMAIARAAVRLDPGDAYAHELLGWTLVASKQFAEAESAFREV